MKTVLVASATDPSGLSGLAQDVRVMHRAGVHAAVVVTGVTAQGRRGVEALRPVSAALIEGQWSSALPLATEPRVVKVGLVPSLAGARRLSRLVRSSGFASVVDTPFLASWGGRLTRDDPVSIARTLARGAALVTPNTDEAGRLAGMKVRDEEGMMAAARRILEIGAGAVLVKGGHLPGPPVDLLATPEAVRTFRRARSATKPRGTGCALSSLIAARMAQGLALPEAVESAEREFPRGMAGLRLDGGAVAYDASKLTGGAGRLA